MGRHRRSAAGRAATGRATGVTQTYGTYTGRYSTADAGDYATEAISGAGQDRYEANGRYAQSNGLYAPSHDYAHSDAYLFSTGDTAPGSAAYLYSTGDVDAYATTSFAPTGDPRGGRSHRRRKKAAVPVRGGLLGVSAAVAMGAVAVASGLLPGGGDKDVVGGNNAGKVQTSDFPTGLETQGGTDGSADDRDDSGASRDTDRSPSPTPTPTKPAEEPTKKPTTKPTTKAPEQSKPKPTPPPPVTKVPKPTPPKAVSPQSAAEAEVLSLVNQEREKAGCSPVTASSSLAALAQDFSKAMAVGDFFDHTDPNGATPWDRAKGLGIGNLGGENIARGQADAAAVMEAWMNSPGHRANILNCDFKTLGVGAHFDTGGPWWTQDFGY
ncbi:CAP domain-containing protein [Streptomyces sp. HC44]|uniref:CAP domain-containing protein n=1 Tax=Streptomyces scabichelini TaxID=2711217 RepID=A0A6G4V437_9ACTN|nr:CAP domain-containing protein [Streptomyces scabichelini]NGO08637.1 CAP domain-containing protein [Streptomyces scabichelini]